MKKSFVLFLAILVFGAFIIGFGQSSILAEKANVKITENILYGEKSVVEGVTLELQNHYENQIFWDTTYMMGEEPKTNTEYTFHQAKQSNVSRRWYGNIYFNDDICFLRLLKLCYSHFFIFIVVNALNFDCMLSSLCSL